MKLSRRTKVASAMWSAATPSHKNNFENVVFLMYLVYVSLNVCIISAVVCIYIKTSLYMCIFHHRDFSFLFHFYSFKEVFVLISVAHFCVR